MLSGISKNRTKEARRKASVGCRAEEEEEKEEKVMAEEKEEEHTHTHTHTYSASDSLPEWRGGDEERRRYHYAKKRFRRGEVQALGRGTREKVVEAEESPR